MAITTVTVAITTVTEETVQNGFWKCGIYPFDVEAIDFQKFMSNASRTVGDEKATIKVKPTEFKIEHLLYLESVMPLGRAEEFRKCEKEGWKGCETAKELFEVWKKLRQRSKVEEQDEELAPGDMIKENQVTIPFHRNDQAAQAEIYKENRQMDQYTGEKAMDVENCISKINIVEDEAEKNLTIENSKPTLSEIFLQPSTSTPLGEKIEQVPNTSTAKSSTPKTSRRISTSFIDHIFWPTESPEKKGYPKTKR